uniref:MADF domain-containing protein n=1 Tax=Panagrellus redivivus TaxID=6233 RepID=A0A7E4UVQ8_PANRE
MSLSPQPSDSASSLPGSGTRLIELVQPYPELYDKSHPLYCNNAHKGVLWNQISKELDAGSAKKTREQFSYMRKRFKVEYDARKKGIRRPLAPEPDSANYRQPLFVYEQLSFLEKALDMEWEMEKEAEEKGEDEDSKDEDVSAPTMVQTEPDCESNGIISIPSRKRRTTSPVRTTSSTTSHGSIHDTNAVAQIIRAITNASPTTAEDPEPPSTTIDDEECRIFGKQIAMDLRRLNERDRAAARYLIHKVVLTALLHDMEAEQPVAN